MQPNPTLPTSIVYIPTKSIIIPTISLNGFFIFAILKLKRLPTIQNNLLKVF